MASRLTICTAKVCFTLSLILCSSSSQDAMGDVHTHEGIHACTFCQRVSFCSQNNWHRWYKCSTFLCSLLVSPGFMHFLNGTFLIPPYYFLVLSLKSKNLSLVLERDGLMVKITYALEEDLSLVLSTYTRWLMTPCNSNSWEIWCPLWLLSGTCTQMHIPTQRHIT